MSLSKLQQRAEAPGLLVLLQIFLAVVHYGAVWNWATALPWPIVWLPALILAVYAVYGLLFG